MAEETQTIKKDGLVRFAQKMEPYEEKDVFIEDVTTEDGLNNIIISVLQPRVASYVQAEVREIEGKWGIHILRLKPLNWLHSEIES